MRGTAAEPSAQMMAIVGMISRDYVDMFLLPATPKGMLGRGEAFCETFGCQQKDHVLAVPLHFDSVARGAIAGTTVPKRPKLSELIECFIGTAWLLRACGLSFESRKPCTATRLLGAVFSKSPRRLGEVLQREQGCVDLSLRPGSFPLGYARESRRTRMCRYDSTRTHVPLPFKNLICYV